MIDGFYRITGRAQPVVVFAAPRPTRLFRKA